jgi:hypothetical protein
VRRIKKETIRHSKRMANTSNASKFLLNIVELQNTITNAAGTSAVTTLSNSVSQLQQMIDFNAKAIKTNTISQFNTSPITVTDSLNLSNASLLSNGQVVSVGTGSTLVNGPTAVSLYSTTAATTAFQVAVGSPSATPFQILGDGSMRLQVGTPTVGYYLTCMDGNGTAEWQAPAVPSDARLKMNVRPLEDAGAALQRLQGVRFEWKASGKGDVGMIAQDVAAVVPEAVFTSGTSSTLMMNYTTLVPYLIETVKSLQARVSTLEGLRQ